MPVFHREFDEHIERQTANRAIHQLLRHWREDHTDSLPTDDAFIGKALGWCGPNLMILDPTGDGDYSYRHYGSAIAKASGFDLTGKRTSTLSSSVGAYFSACYDRVVSDKKPLYTIHKAIHAPTVHSLERLILPLASEHGITLAVYNRPLEYRQQLVEGILRATLSGILALEAKRDAAGAVVDFSIIVANPAVEEYTGMTRHVIEQSTLLGVFPDMAASGTFDMCVRIVETGETESVEQPDWRNGDEKFFLLGGSKVGDGLVLCATDVTEQRQALEQVEQQRLELVFINSQLEQQAAELVGLSESLDAARAEMERLATTDTMTGIPNRRAFMEYTANAVERAREDGTTVAIILTDIDRFKSVNDRFGHAVGDSVIKAFAATLASVAEQKNGIAGRIGGEEFAVVIPGINVEHAVEAAEEMRREVSASEVWTDQDVLRFTASFGVISEVPTTQSLDDLLNLADEGLYDAKGGGRNKVSFRAQPRKGE